MKRDLQFEIVYPHPPTEVWRALTDPGSLAAWLMDNDFAPSKGHKFHFRSKSRFGPRRISCEVLAVDEPRLLSFSWGGQGSVVTFRLEPAAEGTRLRLEHTGLSGVRGLALGWVLRHGWVHKIGQRLPEVLSRMTEQTRFKP